MQSDCNAVCAGATVGTLFWDDPIGLLDITKLLVAESMGTSEDTFTGVDVVAVDDDFDIAVPAVEVECEFVDLV